MTLKSDGVLRAVGRKMTSIKRRERVLSLSLSFAIHLIVFFIAISLYLQGGIITPPTQPLSVEFVSLPKPTEQVAPKEPQVLSDASRRVERETRQREDPSEGITRQAGIPKLLGGPPPTALPFRVNPSLQGEPPIAPNQQGRQAGRPAPVPQAPPHKGEGLSEDLTSGAPKPPAQTPRESAKELHKTEEAGPPKGDVASESRSGGTVPRIAEKEAVPEKGTDRSSEQRPARPSSRDGAGEEERDRPRIASLPSSPEVGRAPSLAEGAPAPMDREGKGPTTAKVPSSATLPPLIREPSKEKGTLPLSQLLPSQERLARLPSLKKEGTEAKVVKEETVSLNTQEFKYYSYFLKLKKKIENVWAYPPEAAAQGQQGQLFMEFSITKKGSLEEMKLLRSSNYPVLDEEALKAVKAALTSPMPFPEAWGLDRINVRASFSYHLSSWNVQ